MYSTTAFIPAIKYKMRTKHFGKGDKKEDYFLYTSAHHSVQSKTSKIKLLTILSSSIIPHSSSDFEKPSIHHIKCV